MLRSLPLVLVLLGRGASAGPGDPAGENPFEVELAELAARLRDTRARPEGVVAVLRAASMDDDLAPGRVESLLLSVVDAVDTDPLVAAHARYLWAAMVERRGDAARAERERRKLGLIEQFLVIGPFDNEARAGHKRVFGPETDGAPGSSGRRTHSGKDRDVRWRAGDAGVLRGALHFDALLRPDQEATAYASTFVRSPAARDVALRIGSSGPTKIWCNGRLVLDHDVVRAAALDQDAAPVRLRRGWNHILVKAGVTQGAWRLFVRLTDPAGKPLPDLTASANPAAVGRVDPREARPAAVRNLANLLAERARTAASGGAGAEAWFDLGRFRALVHPGDRDAREAEAAMRQAVARDPNDRHLVGLAEVAAEDDDGRQALDRALSAASAGVRRAAVLARLGDAARGGRREVFALDCWRRALAESSGYWPASLALASERHRAGLSAAGLAMIDALPSAFREIPHVRRDRARLLEALGRRSEAADERRLLLATRQDDVELLRELSEAARLDGDVTTWLALLRRAATARPDVPSLNLDLARALEGSGDGAGALRTLEALAARLPDDARAHEELGRLLHRLGRRDGAIEHLQQALELRPQSPELRRYAERVSAESGGLAAAGGEDLARRFAADVEALAAARPAKVEAGPDSAVVLLDRRAVRVHANGLSEAFAQRVTEIRTERGARDFAQFQIRYSPGSEDVEVRQARAFRRGAGGRIAAFQAAGRDDRDLSEPWYGLYYDTRAEVIRWEGLRPGDIIEVQYVIANVSSRNEMADYFGDIQTIGEGVRKERWDYTLLGPAGRTFHFNQPRVPGGLRPVVTEEGGTRVYAFSLEKVPRVEPEPAMPGWAEVAPYLHVSTFASWLDVGAWYGRLIDQQLQPDDAVKEAARGAVRSGMSAIEKVRAIHTLVVTQTRYVALEFGIHGYKPYKVSQVLQRKFGDCKDKASLLVSMLREVGIPAEMVLLRTRRGGRIDPEPASLAPFDHAIAYVPSLDLYLDGTAEFSGTRELPGQDQAATALHIEAGGGRLVETPIFPSSDNRVTRNWAVALDASGGGRVSEEVTLQGQAAPEWREHYQTPGERLERYGNVWGGRNPGARLVSLEMPGLADLDAPVRVQAVALVPRLGQSTPAGVELPVASRDPDYARSYARLSSRRHDLVLGYPWQHDETIAYALPEGWEVVRLPASRLVDTQFGRFSLDVDRDRRLVRLRSRLDVTRQRVSPADYPAFRRFLGEVDAALGQRLVARPADPSAPALPEGAR